MIGTEIKQSSTVGQEFMEWAETYWHLDKILEEYSSGSFAGEKCDYIYMRKIFIQKIDALIKDRLSL